MLLSAGVDVYVRGNSTCMGLFVHACIPVCVGECVNVHQVTCFSALHLLFSCRIHLFALCVQVCERSEKEVSAQGLPSTSRSGPPGH